MRKQHLMDGVDRKRKESHYQKMHFINYQAIDIKRKYNKQKYRENS